jgi:hypothetical protein
MSAAQYECSNEQAALQPFHLPACLPARPPVCLPARPPACLQFEADRQARLANRKGFFS